MNHIYKVIWSKVKHAYVVVSELTRSNGKSHRVKRVCIKGSLAAVLTFLTLTSGNVFAADSGTSTDSTSSTKTTTVSAGKNTGVTDKQAGDIVVTPTTSGDNTNYEIAINKDVVLGEQEKDKGGSLRVNNIDTFEDEETGTTTTVKEYVNLDGKTISSYKNDGTNDQRQVVLGVGQDAGGYLVLF